MLGTERQPLIPQRPPSAGQRVERVEEVYVSETRDGLTEPRVCLPRACAVSRLIEKAIDSKTSWVSSSSTKTVRVMEIPA